MMDPVDAFLGLGSNLGERRASLLEACELLAGDAAISSLRLSTIRETLAVGEPGAPALGGPYLNAACVVRTTLDPQELFQLCLGIERRLGRVRTVRNAARTIDLDLLLYADLVIDRRDREGSLIVPHPRMLERKFVLEPVAELAPEVVHPLTAKTVAWHLERLRGLKDVASAPDLVGSGADADTEGLKMLVTDRTSEASRWSARMRAAGLSVGLVPTMGVLHEGHRSLIRAARRECDRVAVSIFVNPTQFDQSEDLDAYSRDSEGDVAICRQEMVDLVFLGRDSGEDAVYRPGHQTAVRVEQLSEPLCGRFRPAHFGGVATVVTLLFGILRPHRSYFGLKDYQQARLIESLAADLHTGVEVRTLPTVREADGLALSSRNARLSTEDRDRARALSSALFEAREAFRGGEDRPSTLRDLVRGRLEAAEGVELQYVEALDALTLQEPTGGSVRGCEDGVVLAVAAHVGGTRLIDNVWLRPGDEIEPLPSSGG